MKLPITLFFLTLCFCAIGQIPTENLMLSLSFSNNAEDLSGNDNEVLLFGPTAIEDRYGNTNAAMNFDGVDDYIEIIPGNDWSELGDFSISVWFKLSEWEDQFGMVNGIRDQQYLFNGHAHSNTVSSDYFRDGFNVVLYLENDFNTFIRNTTVDLDGNTFSNNINNEDLVDNWHHNVFVREGNKAFHYLDGILVAETANDDAILNVDHSWYLGTFSGNNPNYNDFNYNFSGNIDDIRMYNKALSSTDVNFLYYETPCISGTTFVDTITVIDSILVIDSITVTETLLIDVTLTDANNLQVVNTISVYPNPTNDLIFINTGDFALMSDHTIRIINSLGVEIFAKAINQSEFQIDLNEFGASGIYFIQILDANQELIALRKIILQ